jgi:hypothetical protein
LTLINVLLWVQGLYFLLTGVWPLVSVETFQLVTGRKTDHLQSPNPSEADHWLVMTVGALVTVLPVYLADAAVEVALVVAWVVALLRWPRAGHPLPQPQP